MAHAQGPWRIESFAPLAEIWSDLQRIALVGDPDTDYSDDANCDELDATTRLIAAAPEMFQLLDGILTYADTREHLESKFPGLVRKIKAVCAKVKGAQ